MKLSPQFGASPSGEYLERIKRSQHFKDDKFINLIPTSMDMSLKDGLNTMREWVSGGNNRSPQKPLPTQFDVARNQEENSGAKIIWYGHSAISLEIDGLFILIDPMFGNAASPVPFMTKRFPYSTPISIDNLPDVDAVILSHDHYDHLDYPTIMKLKDKVAHFYTPLGVGSHLRSWGISEEKITEMDWWQSVKIDSLEIITAPARHFSGRGLTDRNKTQWASWIINGNHEKIYFSGDSGYGPHFKEIGDKYGPFDFALLECGQYNEKWEAIHMMPEQTIQASLDVRAKRMMPIHWSAFNLSLHSWVDPVDRAVKAAKKHDVDIVTPVIGAQFEPMDWDFNNLGWWNDL